MSKECNKRGKWCRDCKRLRKEIKKQRSMKAYYKHKMYAYRDVIDAVTKSLIIRRNLEIK